MSNLHFQGCRNAPLPVIQLQSSLNMLLFASAIVVMMGVLSLSDQEGRGISCLASLADRLFTVDQKAP